MKQPRLLAGSVFFVGIFVLAATLLVRANRTRTLESLDTPITPPENAYRVDLLAEEACDPGKVVRAVQNGKTVEQYTCSAQDSAAAWISIRGGPNKKGVDYCRATANDDRGHQYLALTQAFGDLYLIRLENGYAKRPGSISVTVQYSTGIQGVQESLLTFTQLSDPKIVLRPLTPKEATASKEVAAALFYSGPNLLNVRVAQPLGKKEYVYPHILATSYCAPAEQTSGHDGELPSELISAYGNQTETVKMRLERYKYVPSHVTLTYKNAKIVEQDGYHMIQFSSAQTVGELAGSKASILSQLTGVSMDAPSKVPYGVLTIDLTSDHDHADQAALVNPGLRPAFPSSTTTKWTFESMSPSLGDLGLSRLLLRVKDSASKPSNNDLPKDVSFFVKSSSPKAPPVDSVIPELKLRFLVNTQVSISSTTAVLPLQHRSGRALFQLQTATAMHPQ